MCLWHSLWASWSLLAKFFQTWVSKCQWYSPTLSTKESSSWTQSIMCFKISLSFAAMTLLRGIGWPDKRIMTWLPSPNTFQSGHSFTDKGSLYQAHMCLLPWHSELAPDSQWASSSVSWDLSSYLLRQRFSTSSIFIILIVCQDFIAVYHLLNQDKGEKKLTF